MEAGDDAAAGDTVAAGVFLPSERALTAGCPLRLRMPGRLRTLQWLGTFWRMVRKRPRVSGSV
jgi:hypothetical protein